jgi:hypothetical protein
MQWLWVAVFALCAARLCGAAEPGSGFQVVPMWAHVHQKLNGDDGTEAAASIVQWLKDEHYKGILFTPHANNISFEEYRSIVDPLNTGDFLVLAGRELNVAREVKEDGKILCHVNALSDVAAPAVMDASPWAEDLPGLMAELDREGALYIWNHPWSCPAWSANPELFKGIEFFNDFGPGYIDGVTYEVARTAYLDALRAGARPFVVSGIDMHMMSQTVTGEFITYAFPDTFTRESLLAAMHSGHLVAAFNARLLALNQRPGIRTRTTPDGDLHISGTAATRFYNGYKPELIIYKNGDDFEPAEPAVFTRRDKKSKGYSVYDFSFTVSADPGAKTCFSFEIPHYIMSSPYCLAATPAN